MREPPRGQNPKFFETSAAFRSWLEAHAGHENEILVGYYKVGSGRPSLSWSASVDEAICFGWIDGVRKRIDDESYQIRFTPRKEGSIWSAVNIAKAEALIEQGRMRPAGLAAFERRTERKSRVYSYEQDGSQNLSKEEQRRFKKNRQAWRFFETAPPGYRRTVLHWVTSAKRAVTRTRRLSKLVDACARGQRLFK